MPSDHILGGIDKQKAVSVHEAQRRKQKYKVEQEGTKTRNEIKEKGG